MDEIYENEQFFFNKQTISILVEFLKQYTNPCILCVPKVGEACVRQHLKCSILDIDTRFANISGFHKFNIKKPVWIDEKFDIILCDPPFFNVKLSQLFKAIRLLSQFDFTQYLLISFLVRRSKKLLQVFSPFNLQSSGYYPSYLNVEMIEKNKIEFFTNLPKDKLKILNSE